MDAVIRLEDIEISADKEADHHLLQVQQRNSITAEARKTLSLVVKWKNLATQISVSGGDVTVETKDKKNQRSFCAFSLADVVGIKVEKDAEKMPKRLRLVTYGIDSDPSLVGCGIGSFKRARKELVFQVDATEPVKLKEFVKALQARLWIGRPRRVVVIINPIGGHAKGRQQWAKVRPIFIDAGVDLIELETKKSKHAFELVQDIDITACDALICVGGDGLVYEVLNALMSRDDKEKAIKTPLGIIPAGSQNALAMSAAGTVDVVEHALFIVKGITRALDLSMVRHINGNYDVYSSIFTSYGYLGTITEDSENYRWMGPSRYFYAGSKQIAWPKFYTIKLSFIPEHSEDNSWVNREVEVFCLMVFNISGANTQFPVVCPEAELDDGCLSVCLWKKCSRVDLVKYVVAQRVERHTTLDFIEIFKVKALKFEPVGNTTPLDVDGEVLPASALEFSVLPKAVTLMTPFHRHQRRV